MTPDDIERLKNEWNALDERMNAEIARPRMSVEGFLSLMRERDHAGDRYRNALRDAMKEPKAP
jgi:hypothetical protein